MIDIIPTFIEPWFTLALIHFVHQGKTISQDMIDMIPKLIEPWFVFALIWSVGGSCDGDGRKKFSEFVRTKMKEQNVSLLYVANLNILSPRYLTFNT